MQAKKMKNTPLNQKNIAAPQRPKLVIFFKNMDMVSPPYFSILTPHLNSPDSDKHAGELG